MEYCELKQEAKDRRIKFYYIMRKAELIQLLSMDPLPEQYRIEKMRIRDLRTEARLRGIPAVYSYSRSMLVQLLYPHMNWKTRPENYNKNYNYAYQHDSP